MAAASLIDEYLHVLGSRMRGRRDRADLVDEIADHLHSAVERLEAVGIDAETAQRRALARFGEPRLVAALAAAEVVAAEDTRRLHRLCADLGVTLTGRVVSYFEGNEAQRTPSLLEALRADHVRTARAKGLPERTVIGRHALRNALIPVVTYAGVSLGVLFGGAIITETIFQYNGVGYLLSRAIVSSNAPVIIAVVVFSVVAYVLLSLLVDILYAVLDPRIRLS